MDLGLAKEYVFTGTQFAGWPRITVKSEGTHGDGEAAMFTDT